ncbi:MAG TPA: TfuA-like protein, partial [Alphaproteobacteria bacterium]|nr:TfuA-like protein [Alphaproteobacteria bacterium]
LRPFGMVGVGRVHAGFLSGELEDDDEVAVVHGPAELGYKPLSEALVDIRATLCRAAAEGALSPGHSADLLGIAKRLFFKQRTYDRILRDARAAGAVGPAALAAFADWLPAGRVRLKRADALLMIAEMRAWLDLPPTEARPGFAFEPSRFWRQSVREILVPAPPSLRRRTKRAARR